MFSHYGHMVWRHYNTGLLFKAFTFISRCDTSNRGHWSVSFSHIPDDPVLHKKFSFYASHTCVLPACLVEDRSRTAAVFWRGSHRHNSGLLLWLSRESVLVMFFFHVAPSFSCWCCNNEEWEKISHRLFSQQIFWHAKARKSKGVINDIDDGRIPVRRVNSRVQVLFMFAHWPGLLGFTESSISVSIPPVLFLLFKIFTVKKWLFKPKRQTFFDSSSLNMNIC